MYIDRSGSQIAALHLSLSFECNAAQFVSAGHICILMLASSIIATFVAVPANPIIGFDKEFNCHYFHP